MDQLLYGLDHSTVALIISEHYQTVSEQIGARLDRGATVLDGSGSYTGQPRPVLMSAVRQRELPELKKQLAQEEALAQNAKQSNLLRDKVTEEEIAKIMGGNLLRIYKEVLK